MPKVTKDSEKDELNKKKSTTKKKTDTAKSTTKTTKSKTKKETTSKVDKKEVKEKSTKNTTKNTVKKEATSTKKGSSKKSTTTVAKKSSTKTSTTSATKKTTAKKSTTTEKKPTAKKSSTTKKKSSTSTAKKKATAKSKKLESNIVAEYYDLPYRYNETVVKILYQTPTILFVYWDISDYDRENYIKQYGENFFNNTRPVLKIYNLTKDYSFEIEINDFANSWYINVNDANCKYKVELSRKAINFVENLNSEYVYIFSSNDIEFPNDHILLEELPSKIKFKNVKTNQVSIKDISTLHLIGINKIYRVHDFYKRFYKDELLEDRILNSSSSWN